MNRYDKFIIFILLKICRILSNYCSFKYADTMIYTIEKELKEDEKK